VGENPAQSKGALPETGMTLARSRTPTTLGRYPMKFEIAHTFDTTLDEYAEIYFDEAFGFASCEAVNIGRKLLKLEKSPERIVRQVRCEPSRELPAPIAKLLGGGGFSYVDDVEYDPRTRKGKWRIVPSIAPDKVESTGTFEFVPDGAGKRRIIRGDINVKVFGLGGIIEKFVVGDVEKSYEKAAAFTREWIAATRK